MDDGPARLFQLLLIGGLIGLRDFPAAGLERGALFKQDLLIFGRQGLEQLLIDEQGPIFEVGVRGDVAFQQIAEGGVVVFRAAAENAGNHAGLGGGEEFRERQGVA